ncbi:MAG TPA: HPF/RaiA family ribosome-associated protein [Burkholderiales bacterium]|nr:HPF/RaiA family ribosome-associated protein [Burkholderiales bacterium]
MATPLQITFRDMDPSPALEARIREKMAKLEALDERITSGRVVVERLSARRRSGNEIGVLIELAVPGPNILIDDIRNEDAYVAVRDAFDAAERMLIGANAPERGPRPVVQPEAET